LRSIWHLLDEATETAQSLVENRDAGGRRQQARPRKTRAHALISGLKRIRSMTDVDRSQPSAGLREPPVSERLDSWKKIAAYLKRDESTVRRWEKEGLPVHRHAHKKKPTIYAYRSEIDHWWNVGRARLEAMEPASARPRRRRMWWAAAGLMLVGVGIGLGLNVAGMRDRLLGGPLNGEITAMAVLPLKNLSGDAGQDYFADGMTEALINELGKISTLRAISYRSVSGYRQTAKPLPQIARDLGVGALLEGAVVRSGDRVRITVNLVKAVPERHLWAETYEFDAPDVVAVQGKVARDVARHIRVKLTPQQQARLTTSRRVNPEAYEAYLLGRAYFSKVPAGTSWMRAKEYYEKAIAKDPDLAPAYAGMAQLYARTRGSLARDPGANRAQARQWAEKALKLDDTLAETHTALGWVIFHEWDWAGAERQYRRAVELNPSYALARIWYAQYLYAMERFEEAVAQAQVAQQLDPGSLYVNTRAGAAYFLAGRVEEAMASWQKVLELDPGYPDASIELARSYVTRGLHQNAISALQRALTFTEREPLVMGALAHAHARAGQRADALKIVSELKRRHERVGPNDRNIPRFSFIWAYAGLADTEQAFAWLEKAYQERRDLMALLNLDPFVDPLRSDPRFADLVRRVGLGSK
jgi:TolB-like protein/Tfp pilus assembly protein PilF